jgi:hypothetical protein
MPLSRPDNLNPNGRKDLELVVIWDSRRNMLRQSRSSSIHGRASSPLNFTAYLMKTSKPYRTWAACFATLWPLNSKLKPTVTEEYSTTNVPPGLDAPWFLQDDSDDDASSTSSHDTSVDAAASEDHEYLAPTDHLYNEPPATPALDDPFLGEPFTAPPNSQNEGGTANEGGSTRNRHRTRENEGGAARTRENEGAETGTTRENEGAGTGTLRGKGAPTTFQSRSGRTVKVSQKALDSSEHMGSINPAFSTKLAMAHFFAFMATMLDDNTFNDFHPFAYVASLADKDTMNFAEAMKQSD